MATTSGIPGTRLSVEDFDASVLDVEDAISLPPEVYSSPEFYEFEKHAIFDREWLCLGRVEQVPEVGDYFAIDALDEPYMIVRSEPDKVIVLSAVCQHRGMLVAEGSGNCGKAFQCPYHWWRYGLDGRFLGGPDLGSPKRFDRAAIRLPEIRSEIWNGFVFVNLDENAEPLAPSLQRLDEMMANYEIENLRTTKPQLLHGLPFNWKVMMENGIEAYHSSRLHEKYVDFQPSKNYEPAKFDNDDGAILVPMRNSHIDGGLNPTGKIYFPPISTLTEEDRFMTGFGTVPPNLMLGWQPDVIFWFLLLPRGVDKLDMLWGYLMPYSNFELKNFDELLELTISGIEKFNEQDIPVATAMQRGLSSKFAPRGPYSWQEEMLVHVNRWLVKRYRNALTPQGQGELKAVGAAGVR